MSILAELQWQLYQVEERIGEINQLIDELSREGLPQGAICVAEQLRRDKQRLVSDIALAAVANELNP